MSGRRYDYFDHRSFHGGYFCTTPGHPSHYAGSDELVDALRALVHEVSHVPPESMTPTLLAAWERARELGWAPWEVAPAPQCRRW